MTYTYRGYEFEILKRSTISGARKEWQYMEASETRLSQCYTKPSSLKVSIFDDCVEFCRKLNGRDYRIPSYNCQEFSFAFKLPNDYIVYMTKSHNYIIM